MKKNNIIATMLPATLLVAAILAAYINSFGSPFLFDDYHNIVGNEYVNINDISITSLKRAALEGPSRYRWVPKISFALNYYFAGKKSTGYHAGARLEGSGLIEPEVWGYHLVNLLIHIAASICLYFLFREILAPRMSENHARHAREIAFAAALLWSVHPVQTNAVTYVVQRMTSMEGLFVIMSLLFYALGRSQGRNMYSGVALFFISAGCGLLALFSKENGAILPLLFIGYEFYFSGPRSSLPRLRGTLTILALALLLVAALGWFYQGSNPFVSVLQGYAARDFTLAERLLTQPRVIVQYLSLLLLPLPSRLNLAYDFPLSLSILTPVQTFFAFLVIAAMVFFTCFLFRRDRILSFALFWFLANLAIESSFVPLEIIFEHRLYLPSAFLLLFFVARGYAWGRRRILFIRILFIALALLCLLFTWQRNETWSSRENVWADVALKAPGLSRGHMGLYVAYKAQGRDDEAIRALEKAIAVAPGEFRPSFNLAGFYKEKKQYKQALQVLNNMLKRENLRTAPAYHLRASVYSDLQNYQAAAADALQAIAVDPGHLNSLLLLGSAYFRMNSFIEAALYFEKAKNVDPDAYEIYYNLGTTYYNLGEYDKAILNYRRALDFLPNNADTHFNLGMVYGAKGMIREMQEELAISRRLKGQTQ